MVLNRVLQETRWMVTRDGVRLAAEVYCPQGPGRWPFLVMRQPYGRAIASTVVYGHPSWYSAQGYGVVIQDVRGRGDSAGEFDLFAQEKEDGEDCLRWVTEFPECDGTVGMYGFSYQGMTQLYAALGDGVPGLKTICPAMVAWDLYQDWGYENGAFCLQNNLGWALQLGAYTAQRQGNLTGFNQCRQWAQSSPSTWDYVNLYRELGNIDPLNFYRFWVDCIPEDPYWLRRSPHHLPGQITVPVLQIGGWFDPHLRGQLRLFSHLQRQGVTQKLVVGPWGHFPWGQYTGGQDYGLAATRSLDALQIAWFDHWLKGRSSTFSAAPLELFDLSTHTWRELDTFPEATRTWYLHPSGLASQQTAPLTPDRPVQSAIIPDRLVHDPWRPVPSVGGHASSPPGVFDRRALDERGDVLTYTSDPLTDNLTIAGPLTVTLTLSGDRPSFDVAVALSQVTPSGAVLPFSHGYTSLTVSHPTPLTVTLPLQPTCITLNPGDRLRVSLSGASFPAYPVNPGTGQTPALTPAIDHQTVTLTLGGGHVSLPILPAS